MPSNEENLVYKYHGVALRYKHDYGTGELVYKPKRKPRPPRAGPPNPDPEPRTYSSESLKTRAAVKQQVAAILRAAHAQGVKLYFVTISFSDTWALSDKQAREILRKYLLKVKYVHRLKGVPHWFCAVAERQKNGTIHFHVVHSHVKYLPYAETMVSMRAVLSCYVNRPDEVASWNGVHWEPLRVNGFRTSTYMAKCISRLASYITKSTARYECMPWASSYEAKRLPIGYVAPYGAHVITRECKISDYLTLYYYYEAPEPLPQWHSKARLHSFSSS